MGVIGIVFFFGYDLNNWGLFLWLFARRLLLLLFSLRYGFLLSFFTQTFFGFIGVVVITIVIVIVIFLIRGLGKENAFLIVLVIGVAFAVYIVEVRSTFPFS